MLAAMNGLNQIILTCEVKNFFEMLNAYSLDQPVNFPTNLHCGQLKACLDLVATNVTDLRVSSLAPLGNVNHVILKGVFQQPDAMPSNCAHERFVWYY